MTSDLELTKNDIRAGYVAWCRGEVTEGMAGAMFDRFVAKTKANALREAATEFEARLPDGTGNGRAYNSYRVAELLNARADRIEEEA